MVQLYYTSIEKVAFARYLKGFRLPPEIMTQLAPVLREASTKVLRQRRLTFGRHNPGSGDS